MNVQIQSPITLFNRKKHGAHWIGGLVGPRLRLNVLEKGNFFFPPPEFAIFPLNEENKLKANTRVNHVTHPVQNTHTTIFL